MYSSIKAWGLLALLGAATTVQGTPVERRDVMLNLPQNADPKAIKFQPALDFDMDSCYNTAAVGVEGNLNPGLQHMNTGITENCRELNRLQRANVYSRQRCNNGVCAIMYDYYFEKDVAMKGSPVDGGHRHDWENVIVFLRDDQFASVIASCHGEYGFSNDNPRLFDGTHPKIVYHKDGAGTHCFRQANPSDDDPVENETGDWVVSPLVGWNGWPSVALRDKVGNNWNEGVSPRIDDIGKEDQNFGDVLKLAKGPTGFPEFDPYLDA